ncbi:hypothetical protein [Enterococcus nangangensis]|uniref:hypothetical protein n=1 Tax=Enterococcus nangangensis TaxID=2559926 RepID=UPI00148565A8|nr:hypothetical protein [Enterococcus nangangensis]
MSKKLNLIMYVIAAILLAVVAWQRQNNAFYALGFCFLVLALANFAKDKQDQDKNKKD